MARLVGKRPNSGLYLVGVILLVLLLFVLLEATHVINLTPSL